MTQEDIQNELTQRRFPTILTTANYTEIVTAALRKLNYYAPLTRFVSFTTQSDVQDYNIFDTEDAVTAGIADGALELRDVLWNPGGDWSSLNIFSPGWAMLAQMVIFTGSYFNQPSQMVVLRQKLNTWKTQFGSQGWTLIGPCGAASSVLRLYPMPLAETSVVMEIGASYTLDDIVPCLEDSFMQWMQHYAADTLANIYATTAGVDLLNFTDSRDAMKYWEKKADRYRQEAIDRQAGIGGLGERS